MVRCCSFKKTTTIPELPESALHVFHTGSTKTILPAELQELYAALLADSSAESMQIWRKFASNSWYCHTLRTTAARLLCQYHLPADRAEDVAHDALLILARRLVRRPGLGLKAGFGPEGFVGWLRSIIDSHCRQALRRDSRRQARHRDWLPAEFDELPEPDDRLAAMVWEATDALSARRRAVVRAWLDRGSVRRAAQSLRMSTSATRRILTTAFDDLRRQLGFLPARRPKTAD